MAVAVPSRPRPGPVRASVRALAGDGRLAGLAGLALLALVAVYIGRTVAGGAPTKGVALAILPGVVLVSWIMTGRRRSLLLYAALGVSLVPFTSLPAEPLPGLGQVYLADVIVVLALGTWLLDRLTGGPPAAGARSPVLGWPLVLFGAAIIPGLVEGHDRYGAAFLGQPARFVLYAGVAGALARVTADEAYRGIVVTFYTGTVLQALAALYYIGTGGSATDAYLLSTGGSRVLALSTAMYLAGALVLALLNLQLDPHRRLLHVVFAGLALFGVIVSYGRTTYAAVALLLPILFFTLKEMRRAAALAVPFVAPLVVVAAILAPTVAPDLVSTFAERVNPSVGDDSSVVWREHAVDATLSATADQRVAGGGFGGTQTISFAARSYQIGGDPHNSFVYLLAGGGVLALGTFCLLLLVYLVHAGKRLWRSRGTERALVVFSLSMFLIFVVNTLTGPILTVPELLLTFWAVLLLPSLVAEPEPPAAD